MFLRSNLAADQFDALFRQGADGQIYFGWREEDALVQVTMHEYTEATVKFGRYHRVAMKLGWLAMVGGLAGSFFFALGENSLTKAALSLLAGFLLNFAIHLVPAPLALVRVKERMNAAYSGRKRR